MIRGGEEMRRDAKRRGGEKGWKIRVGQVEKMNGGYYDGGAYYKKIASPDGAGGERYPLGRK